MHVVLGQDGTVEHVGSRAERVHDVGQRLAHLVPARRVIVSLGVLDGRRQVREQDALVAAVAARPIDHVPGVENKKCAIINPSFTTTNQKEKKKLSIKLLICVLLCPKQPVRPLGGLYLYKVEDNWTKIISH